MFSLTSTLFGRAHRLQALTVGALTVFVAACTVTPPASPTPPANPSVTPPPASTPGVTPTPGEGAIDHPTGSTDVVLRMENGGGFVPLGFFATQLPEFTLYGDGTLIIRPLEDPDFPGGWDAAMPRLLEGRLDEPTIQQLLGFALTTGRLADARDHYRDDQIADASTTTFTLNAGGLAREVSIYALSEMVEPGPDAAHRAGFAQLAELLRSFEDRARAGDLGDVVYYEPSHYRLTLLETFGEPVGQPIEWPWDDITPASFAAEGEFDRPVAIVSAAQAADLVDLPSGGHPGIAVTHDGTDWLLAVRPLLPDEVPAG
jgi:hypothetical protein